MSFLTALIALIVGVIAFVLIVRVFVFLIKPLIHCFIFGILAMVHPWLGAIYLLCIVYLIIRWIIKKLS